MATPPTELSIDDYFRKRLMPVDGAIPQMPGIDMFGHPSPAGPVGGDLFEYINFQQRYNVDARIASALRLSEQYLTPLPDGCSPRNLVDAHVEWIKSRPSFSAADAAQYRGAKRSEQLRIAEDLRELPTTAGVLLVDAQGHDIISAKIASTVHDTFHPCLLSGRLGGGKTPPIVSERINLRLAESVTARNELVRKSERVWGKKSTIPSVRSVPAAPSVS